MRRNYWEYDQNWSGQGQQGQKRRGLKSILSNETVLLLTWVILKLMMGLEVNENKGF